MALQAWRERGGVGGGGVAMNDPLSRVNTTGEETRQPYHRPGAEIICHGFGKLNRRDTSTSQDYGCRCRQHGKHLVSGVRLQGSSSQHASLLTVLLCFGFGWGGGVQMAS